MNSYRELESELFVARRAAKPYFKLAIVNGKVLPVLKPDVPPEAHALFENYMKVSQKFRDIVSKRGHCW